MDEWVFLSDALGGQEPSRPAPLGVPPSRGGERTEKPGPGMEFHRFLAGRPDDAGSPNPRFIGRRGAAHGSSSSGALCNQSFHGARQPAADFVQNRAACGFRELQ